MSGFFKSIKNSFFRYLPCICVSLCFLPAGLLFGYTISAYVIDRATEKGIVEYGPIILAGGLGLLTAIAMVATKFICGRFIFWHVNYLIAAGVFHLIGSGFFFANGFDNVGAYIGYAGHCLTFIAGLSFLHCITGRASRSVCLSICFAVYLLGLAAAVNVIVRMYSSNLASIENNPPAGGVEGEAGTEDDQLLELKHDVYVNFGGVYLGVSIIVLVITIAVKALTFVGRADFENSLDDEFRIANANGSIFETRAKIIERIEFFYVTKSQHWAVTVLLLFAEAVQYALFIYFVFWFSLNPAIRLTDVDRIDEMLWVIFAGSVISPVVLCFFSAKVSYVAYEVCLITLAIVAMIVGASISNTVTLWLILFFFGLSFGNLQIVLIEVSHFRFTELIIFVSYGLKLLSTTIVYYYFVASAKNSYFFSTDMSTLMAQGFIYVIISCLLALVVGMKVPRTYRCTLFEIQYSLLGIIFKEHQIEQLNVKYLTDGTIPTVTE